MLRAFRMAWKACGGGAHRAHVAGQQRYRANSGLEQVKSGCSSPTAECPRVASMCGPAGERPKSAARVGSAVTCFERQGPLAHLEPAVRSRARRPRPRTMSACVVNGANGFTSVSHSGKEWRRFSATSQVLGKFCFSSEINAPPAPRTASTTAAKFLVRRQSQESLARSSTLRVIMYDAVGMAERHGNSSARGHNISR
jgi:hypothetical protein